jgi:hypothetical protein
MVGWLYGSDAGSLKLGYKSIVIGNSRRVHDSINMVDIVNMVDIINMLTLST